MYQVLKDHSGLLAPERFTRSLMARHADAWQVFGGATLERSIVTAGRWPCSYVSPQAVTEGKHPASWESGLGREDFIWFNS